MGFFSWKCAISDKSIPHDYNGLVHLVLPTNKIVSGYYDGYGHLNSKGKEKDINELVCEALGLEGGPFANRGVFDPKTGKRYIYQKDFETYESVLPDFKKTVNECVRLNLVKDIEGNFEVVNKHVKLVTDVALNNSPSLKFITDKKKRKLDYASLPVSESCEYQGYFYPEDFEDYPEDYFL
jgi:hypothetical protein